MEIVKNQAFFLENILSTGTNGVTLVKTELAILDSNSLTPFPQGYCDIRSIRIPLGYQSAVAETAGVVTAVEPSSPGYSTTYGFTVQQFNPVTKTWSFHTVSYTTASSGTIAAGTICNAWASALALFQDVYVTTSVTSHTLTITTNTGYPQIVLTNAVGGIALAVSTAGVTSQGYPWDLANSGYVQGTTPYGYSSTGVYDRVNMYYYFDLDANPVRGTSTQEYNSLLFIDTTASNYSAFKTSLLAVLQMTKTGAAVAALATA